jgi:hypothetical protein
MKRLWLWCPRLLRIIVILLVSVVGLFVVVAGCGWWYLHPTIHPSDGIVYGQRNGEPLPLPLDVFDRRIQMD